MRLLRPIVPGLVIQAVLVGGGYATGRELVEFFIAKGPATALLAMALTALLFSVGSMIAFELARQYRAFDYRSFCRVFLGRFWVLFEIGYYALLVLVLSVVSAAAGKLLAEMFGSAEVTNSVLFMAAVAFVVFFGNSLIEKVISAWSVVFYATYGLMCVLVVWRFGPALRTALSANPVNYAQAVRASFAYTGYNIVIVPILIFVARHFQSRAQALVAGALAGPLILMPGLAFLLALSAFYPDILAAPLPISVVLAHLGSGALTGCVRIVILGAFIKTSVGLLHGLNERFARSAAERGGSMPRLLRPALAFGIMVVVVFVASSIGIIDLIGRGYRFSSYFFLVLFVLPLLTRGLWLVITSGARRAPATGLAAQVDRG
jgi:uncharacterized membrane protein YkvI